MFCPSCGKSISKKDTVCPNCNEKLQIINGEFHILKEEPAKPKESDDFLEPETKPEEKNQPDKSPQYAGFFIRAIAIFIDAFILIGISNLAGIKPHSIFSLHVNLAEGGIGIIIVWLYHAILESSKWQGTIGNMVCGLNVTNYNYGRINFMQATLRHFCRYLSALILCAGYFMVLFTAKKQALHDKLAGTYVIKIK